MKIHTTPKLAVSLFVLLAALCILIQPTLCAEQELYAAQPAAVPA